MLKTNPERVPSTPIAECPTCGVASFDELLAYPMMEMTKSILLELFSSNAEFLSSRLVPLSHPQTHHLALRSLGGHLVLKLFELLNWTVNNY